MKIDRRKALALLGVSAAAPATAQGLNAVEAAGSDRWALFRHGVASGDPLSDRAVIWTRVTYLGPPDAKVPVWVTWEVASDPGFSHIVAQGRATTGPERDYTVKLDVPGLKPATEYFYRFRGSNQTSPVGRTRTLPAGATKDVVLAVASCTLYPNGYFNAYKAIAALPRVDAVIHLGDYLYEYGGPDSYGMNSAVAGERPHDPPHECVSLADYRRRHAQYKSDPDLQAAHACAPWIVTWDDHETCNDSYSTGAENHQPDKEGDWDARKAAALKAYYEWMPIREPKGRSLAQGAERSFQFGDLASLIMIETRLIARGRQLEIEKDLAGANGKPDVAAFKAKLNDPNRRLLGPAQEAWITAELKRSVGAGHVWQVLGNQVVMAQVLPGSPKKLLTAEQLASLNPNAKRRMDRNEEVAALGIPTALDMWQGYPADRERLYGLFKAAAARPVVLAGDAHSFWANELHDRTGKLVACEFGTTGITSPGAGEALPGLNYGDLVARGNPEVIFNDQVSQGYLLLTLTRDEAKAEMVAVSTITSRTFQTRTVKSYRTRPAGKGLMKLSEA